MTKITLSPFYGCFFCGLQTRQTHQFRKNSDKSALRSKILDTTKKGFAKQVLVEVSLVEERKLWK